MKRLEHGLELLIFNSRWLLAPIYVGLVLSVLLLLVKFVQEFVHIVARMFTSSEGDVILAILTLVDLSLVANLLLIVIFSGYENFVSKIHTEAHEDRPEWMGKVDFSGLKLKLVASIVAISGIELLKAFVNTVATATRTWRGRWHSRDAGGVGGAAGVDGPDRRFCEALTRSRRRVANPAVRRDIVATGPMGASS